MITNCDFEAAQLPLISTLGFEGKISGGLHSDGQFLVFAIGTNLIKSNTLNGQQTFMIGHGNNITCVEMDPCGRYIASGQMNFMGFQADVIIWDSESGCKIGQYKHHLTRVNALSFSYDGKYLLSLGNLDDGNVCLWDTEVRKVVGGGKAIKGISGFPRCVDSAKTRNDVWLVGGDDYLSAWYLSCRSNCMISEKIYLTKAKRDILTIQIDHNDENAFCGTTTGDIVKLKMNLCYDNDAFVVPTFCGLITRKPLNSERGRNNHLYRGGVTALKILKSGDFLIGTGTGQVLQAKLVSKSTKAGYLEQFDESAFPQMCVRGRVTSISVNCDDSIIIGSSVNEIYIAKLGCLDSGKMISSSHYSPVNDISFPNCYSEVFVSCNYEDVRIWNSLSMRELVRINVANMTCNCVIFSNDGRNVISGWSDSNIRTYTPQSGTPLWVIQNAHLRGVAALAITSDDKQLISGGEEGKVNVWSLCPQQLTPIAIMKEHLGPVTSLRIKSDDSEVASSSVDGSIIIWDLKRFVRKTLILQDTLFLDIAYHPNNCVILGVTHNHKLGYFETFDGSTIREFMASDSDPIHSIDVSSDGLYIVTGGADRQIKLWSYKEGKLLRKGIVHSAEVTRVRFSPCSDYILSCCQDGSIFKWGFPKDLSSVSVSICPQLCHLKIQDQPAVTDGGCIKL